MAALGDVRGVEEEAPRSCDRRTYLEPFALGPRMVRRTLSFSTAASSFQRMGLQSFTEETARLITALV